MKFSTLAVTAAFAPSALASLCLFGINDPRLPCPERDLLNLLPKPGNNNNNNNNNKPPAQPNNGGYSTPPADNTPYSPPAQPQVEESKPPKPPAQQPDDKTPYSPPPEQHQPPKPSVEAPKPSGKPPKQSWTKSYVVSTSCVEEDDHVPTPPPAAHPVELPPPSNATVPQVHTSAKPTYTPVMYTPGPNGAGSLTVNLVAAIGVFGVFAALL